MVSCAGSHAKGAKHRAVQNEANGKLCGFPWERGHAPCGAKRSQGQAGGLQEASVKSGPRRKTKPRASCAACRGVRQKRSAAQNEAKGKLCGLQGASVKRGPRR